jgi:hypothetical protein
VVSVTDPYGCILGFLDRSRYFTSSVVTSLTAMLEMRSAVLINAMLSLTQISFRILRVMIMMYNIQNY